MHENLKEELLRIRAREKRHKNEAEAQIADLKAQLAAMTEAKDCAEAAVTSLEIRCRELEAEVCRLKGKKKDESPDPEVSNSGKRTLYNILQDFLGLK